MPRPVQTKTVHRPNLYRKTDCLGPPIASPNSALPSCRGTIRVAGQTADSAPIRPPDPGHEQPRRDWLEPHHRQHGSSPRPCGMVQDGAIHSPVCHKDMRGDTTEGSLVSSTPMAAAPCGGHPAAYRPDAPQPCSNCPRRLHPCSDALNPTDPRRSRPAPFAAAGAEFLLGPSSRGRLRQNHLARAIHR